MLADVRYLLIEIVRIDHHSRVLRNRLSVPVLSASTSAFSDEPLWDYDQVN